MATVRSHGRMLVSQNGAIVSSRAPLDGHFKHEPKLVLGCLVILWLLVMLLDYLLPCRPRELLLWSFITIFPASIGSAASE